MCTYPLPLGSGRILPSTDVIIVNRFELKINILELPRKRHRVKAVSGMVLRVEEGGNNYGQTHDQRLNNENVGPTQDICRRFPLI